MNERQFWRYLGVTASIALLLGGWLISQRSGLTLDLMLAGAFFVLFYTWPLKYYGLGEPAVLLVWGPLMVGGSFYVLAGHWSWDVAWLSLVFALGPTTVLFGKHTDKLEADKGKGVNTLPVILGERRSRYCVLAMIACPVRALRRTGGRGQLQLGAAAGTAQPAQLPQLFRVYRIPNPRAATRLP